MTETERVTDKTLRAWLNAGPVDCGIGGGLTFVGTSASALKGLASWILRFRFSGSAREKVLGRYPYLSLKDAREAARMNRARIQQGVDVAAEKRAERLKAHEQTAAALVQAWYERSVARGHKHPEVVSRVIRRHIDPVIGKLGVAEVRPLHIDKVLTLIVDAGAPTAANDALRYLGRMFHFAVKRQWIDTNPASGFDLSDAGGAEKSRECWLNRDELAAWLLLALCVRKMELLSAKWSSFDLERGIWSLHPSRTKTDHAIEIPLAASVLHWLEEVKVFSGNSEYLFPARRLIHMKNGVPRKNRFNHISPDTLNVALHRRRLNDIEHFTVHDMRRTARTHMAALGGDRFVAERALNHKVRDIEGVYNRYDYFEERKVALGKRAGLLEEIAISLANSEATGQ